MFSLWYSHYLDSVYFCCCLFLLRFSLFSFHFRFFVFLFSSPNLFPRCFGVGFLPSLLFSSFHFSVIPVFLSLFVKPWVSCFVFCFILFSADFWSACPRFCDVYFPFFSPCGFICGCLTWWGLRTFGLFSFFLFVFSFPFFLLVVRRVRALVLLFSPAP